MRLYRHIAPFLALAFTVAAPVLAQPAPTSVEVQQAEARWHEGAAFFAAGNFEAARVAFRQAYTIDPHPAFLQNLGEAELRTGRNLEAARHLEAFLRTASSLTASQRDQATKSLAKATEKLGSLRIETNADDVELRVDDDLVGRSPLGSLRWFVEPGKHVVTARKTGYLDGSEQVFVAAGPTQAVVVRVQRVESVSAVPVAPPPGQESREPPPSTKPNVAAEEPPAGVDPRGLVVVVGIALTGVSLGVAAVYALRVGADGSHIADARSELATDGDCFNPTPALQPTCRMLADYISQQSTDRTVRDVALLSAGGIGVLTAATYLLWPNAPARVVVAKERGSVGVFVTGKF